MPVNSTILKISFFKIIFALLLVLPCFALSQPLQTVKDFGAVGDGVSDDASAIQNAVDSKIGEVIFPRGTYRLTKPIVIALDGVGPTSIVGEGPAKIIMEGSGSAFQWIGTHDGTANPRTVEENVWLKQRTPTIKGIEIVGKHPESIGISLEGTMQAIVSRVLIRNTNHAIYMTKRNRNVIISDCHIYENRGIGIYMNQLNLHQINITNCHISYNRQGGIVVRDSEIRNLQIGVCDIEGNMSPDTPSTANILIDTTEGSVREGSIVGCTIQHSHEAPNSANIRFVGRSVDESQKVGNFTISDNVLSDVDINIHLQFARGVILTGNTFWKGFEQNLLVEDSSNIVLGPNLFDRNPDYRPADSSNFIVFSKCTDCTIQGIHITNTFDSEAGILFRRCQRFNITGSTILDCANGGMVLDDVDQFRISDCLIDHTENENYSAIHVTRGKNTMIVDNLIGGTIDIENDSATSKGNQSIEK